MSNLTQSQCLSLTDFHYLISTDTNVTERQSPISSNRTSPPSGCNNHYKPNAIGSKHQNLEENCIYEGLTYVKIHHLQTKLPLGVSAWVKVSVVCLECGNYKTMILWLNHKTTVSNVHLEGRVAVSPHRQQEHQGLFQCCAAKLCGSPHLRWFGACVTNNSVFVSTCTVSWTITPACSLCICVCSTYGVHSLGKASISSCVYSLSFLGISRGWGSSSVKFARMSSGSSWWAVGGDGRTEKKRNKIANYKHRCELKQVKEKLLNIIFFFPGYFIAGCETAIALIRITSR